MRFYFLCIYKSGGNLQMVNDIETSVVRKFNTRRDAKKYAVKNCLGIYQIYEFHYE